MAKTKEVDFTKEVERVGSEIISAARTFEADHGDALNGNKTAAKRARTATKSLTKLAKEYRAVSNAAGKK